MVSLRMLYVLSDALASADFLEQLEVLLNYISCHIEANGYSLIYTR